MILIKILLHCALWSILSIGGNLVVLTDVYRYAVDSQHWLSGTEFVRSFAISQALPGPNGMAIVLVGQEAAGIPGALVALAGKLVPSLLIAYAGASWYEKHQNSPRVRLVKSALVPVTVGLIIAATYILAREVDVKLSRTVLTILAATVTYRYKINPVWLIVVGALAGALSSFTGVNIF